MNLPNKLTTIRLVSVPLFIIVYLIPYQSLGIDIPVFHVLSSSLSMLDIILFLIFALSALTDYFDGYIARKYHLITTFGKFIDPIADKLLVSVSLIMLVNFSEQNTIILIPSIIIICREIMVSGLREFLATLNVGVPVTRLAKWKTAIQMMAITALLLAGRGSEYVYNEIMDIVEAEEFVRINFEGYIQKLGEIFLCISAVLTVITGYIYFKVGFKNF